MAPAAHAWLKPVLQRLPWQLRGLLYMAVFLLGLCAALPWLAQQADRLIGLQPLALPRWLQLAGLGLFALATLLYVCAAWWLMSRGKGAYVEFDPPARLVSDGPYEWSRNPVAACVLLMVAGLAVWMGSPVLLAVGLAAFLIAHAQVVLVEEPLLAARFGEAYAQYRRRVPRWLPRPALPSGS